MNGARKLNSVLRALIYGQPLFGKRKADQQNRDMVEGAYKNVWDHRVPPAQVVKFQHTSGRASQKDWSWPIYAPQVNSSKTH